MTKKKIEKFILLPDTKDGQYVHAVLKYKILSDVIKVRIKYYYATNTIEVKAITGAVKNPNLCRILDVKALAREINNILDNRVEFEPRLTEEMLMTQFVNQGLIYPF